jgi:hypothetical protein
MTRPAIRLGLALFAAALVAVPAASAKSRDHRVVPIKGTCSQQSTSKLKLSREDNGIEVEFQVDQNRNGVPWTVTLKRNGNTVASFTATTRGPSGSFEIHRVVAGRLGTDRITAVATRASGETCTADSSAPKGKAPTANKADDNGVNGHDVGDDNGHHSGAHA